MSDSVEYMEEGESVEMTEEEEGQILEEDQIVDEELHAVEVENQNLSQENNEGLENENALEQNVVVLEEGQEILAVGSFDEDIQELQEDQYLEEDQFVEEGQVLDGEEEISADIPGADYIIEADSIVLGGEEDVVLAVEGDDELSTTYEDEDYNNIYVPETFTGDDGSLMMTVEDTAEVIVADTEVAETIIDNSLIDDDKENGDTLLADDEAEIEPVLEIARRRLSHEGNCYCGKDRNLNIAELLCASCHRWYHESCIGYQLGKLVPFMMNYIFICKNCSPTGLETFKRNQAPFTQMCVTAIANLTQASVKEGSNRQMFSKDKDIIPFFEMHWEGMTTLTRRVTQSWRSTVTRTLQKETGLLFTVDDSPEDPDSPYFGLLALDLTQIRPNYEAMIRAGHLKLAELLQSSGQGMRRGSGKRRTVGGEMIAPSSQASIAKKTRGDTFLAKAVLGHGYPTEHPYNKDGYRYVLAEPDSNAPFRQEFDESSDWAGKPIPGWLYRVLNPSHVLLALHDRAPQLKISEDRYSVTGEKGYCMIRTTHGVSKGSWYWEAKITDLPEGAATRIGWSQIHANLQAPLGFDKFSYSWRSRYGTKFHESIGKSYCRGGYTLNDVLGFLIILPQPQPNEQFLVPDDVTPLVPDSYKDRPLVRFKSHLYYEDKDMGGEIDIKTVRPGSKIICFKNGVCQGVAYENIYEGTYFPSVSLYKGSTVKVNFGPSFEHPPSPDDFIYKGYCERSEDAIIEQTLADVLFLTENDGKLSLDNAVPALM